MQQVNDFRLPPLSTAYGAEFNLYPDGTITRYLQASAHSWAPVSSKLSSARVLMLFSISFN